MSKKLSTDPYKGVRDFFPEDMAMQKKIFGIWRDAAEKFGYEEYNASVLEPAELYKAKTGDEIVNEQTYTFIDRGEREVTLRPEMTPTVARMVAARKRELVFPIRWYSIPNLFRYEQPQRGRLREHWQLNVDIFGVTSIAAEIEIINIASNITKGYGLKEENFEIRINNRPTVDYVLKEVFSLDADSAKKVAKLIDKKAKMDQKDFEKGLSDIVGAEKSTKVVEIFNSKDINDFEKRIKDISNKEIVGLDEIKSVQNGLNELGIKNSRFDITLMRGFDYYTGIVFEVFDKNPLNKRSVFGGGRYDDLLSLFGNDKITAVGFGAGDVIARDLIETYGNKVDNESVADLAICLVDTKDANYALSLAEEIRKADKRVMVDISGKKLGDQIKNADKKRIPKVICIGDGEIKTSKFKIKTLANSKEDEVSLSNIAKSL